MAKRLHELRDPLHDFIAFDDDERRIIDSPPLQRLRSIHQLALTYMVYPGATHKRFEHSLGVMHLAGRAYDVITRPDKVSDEVREAIPEFGKGDHSYWRTAVRIAALCHDIGHLPFSHAAEEELLAENVDHELLTWRIVRAPKMVEIFETITPPVRADDIGKLAIGARKVERLKLDVDFDPWEAILAEVIVGDAFGTDRMDYLLRDSLHAGVRYGHFDHERLINKLRVIPEPAREESEDTADPVLGCERGGLHSAEQLLLARYFMFNQVYHHPTRLAYNEHLKDFLKLWLQHGVFPEDADGHLGYDDTDVLREIKAVAQDAGHPAHEPARRILDRNHFKKAYAKRADGIGGASDEIAQGDTSADVKALAGAAETEFGPHLVAYGAPPSKKKPPDFAVYEDGKSVWAMRTAKIKEAEEEDQ